MNIYEADTPRHIVFARGSTFTGLLICNEERNLMVNGRDVTRSMEKEHGEQKLSEKTGSSRTLPEYRMLL